MSAGPIPGVVGFLTQEEYLRRAAGKPGSERLFFCRDRCPGTDRDPHWHLAGSQEAAERAAIYRSLGGLRWGGPR